mgnify:FL=1
MNLNYSDGSLWTTHATKHNWNDETDEYVTATRWYEIDPTTPEVLVSGTYGEPGTCYFIPRIETSGEGTLLELMSCLYRDPLWTTSEVYHINNRSTHIYVKFV